jgi:predicted RNase H-like HicB family nuclease
VSERAQLRYTVVLFPEPEEGGFSVIVPALPGCVTQGDTLEEALTNAREAIQVHVRGLAKHGEIIPEEEIPPHIVTVEVLKPAASAVASQ